MDESVLLSAAFILLRSRINKTEKKKKRALWVRPFSSKRSTSESVTRELVDSTVIFLKTLQACKKVISSIC